MDFTKVLEKSITAIIAAAIAECILMGFSIVLSFFFGKSFLVITSICRWICWGVIVVLMAEFVLLFFGKILTGMKNIRNYRGKGECFREIDYFKRCWDETKYNEYYIYNIKKINAVYKRNEELKNIIRENKLNILYERQDYLKECVDYYENLMNIMISLGVSAVVSIAIMLDQNKNVQDFITEIFLFISVIVLLFARYMNKGQGGSFQFKIYEYEMRKLEKIIITIEENMKCTEEEEKIIDLKQDLIKKIIKKRSKITCKKDYKKNIVNDIKKVYKYDLSYPEKLEENNVTMLMNESDYDSFVSIIDKYELDKNEFEAITTEKLLNTNNKKVNNSK